MSRWGANAVAAVAALVMATPGCFDSLGGEDYMSNSYGKAGAKVLDLTEGEVAALMDLIYVRASTYFELREALPYSALTDQSCATSSEPISDGTRFRFSMSCALGPDIGSGSVTLEQRELSLNVSEFAFSYNDVTAGSLTVVGSEVITQTEGQHGSQVVAFDLVQNGLELVYEFRAGQLESGQDAFDYVIDTPDGQLVVRLVLDPYYWGPLGTAFVTGTDGVLTCELRETKWEIGSHARGHCDNGMQFGMP